MLSVWNDMEFVFTGMWDKGVGNDVWFNVVVLLASEDCSFYDGDNGGGSEVQMNMNKKWRWICCIIMILIWFVWWCFWCVIICPFTITIRFWCRSWIFSFGTWSIFLSRFSFLGIVGSVDFTGCTRYTWALISRLPCRKNVIGPSWPNTFTGHFHCSSVSGL